MITASVIHFWKKSPFIRFLLPFATGIVMQWNWQFPLTATYIFFVLPLLVFLGFFLIPFFHRYKLSYISGLCVFLLFASLGALITYREDICHSKKWFGHFYKQHIPLLATIEEPPIEKPRSIKALASISYVVTTNKPLPVKGKIILYFKKDLPLSIRPHYGSRIIFEKPLEEIKNSGNPGSFDYKRYCFFQGITHQLYLEKNEFVIISGSNKDWLNALLFSIRKKTVSILQKNIRSEKEQGLAEALLIGYKDDLDKTLVQDYTNTGVVHIIAISGLHLGLIYGLLVLLLRPFKKRKTLAWISPVFVIAGLWLFSLLAGAQPSVLRSALMFTCLAIGESIGRKTNIYNSLALSAFLLLCYNPYWLWDVGFQLSYSAVLSIVIFMRPVYNLFYIKNKVVNSIWKLIAVTLAAQILTLPLSLYHFHQFPNYFLFTNLVAVPLSSLILIGEIFLCAAAFIPTVAVLTGRILGWLIWLMNSYIEKIGSIPFHAWQGFQINILQAALLYFVIAGAGYWLIGQSKTGLKTGLIALWAFAFLRSCSFIEAKKQQRLIIYNLSRKSAMDLIAGRHYLFAGDSSIEQDDFTRNFYLGPSRTLYRVSQAKSLSAFVVSGNFISWNNLHILLPGKSFNAGITDTFLRRQIIDLLIISQTSRVDINKLAKAFDIRQVVFDSSVPAWKSKYWKKDCDSLHIPVHDITAKGAFAMTLR